MDLRPIDPPELPEGFPPPPAIPPGTDVAWYDATPEGPGERTYVHLIGNGSSSPYVLVVYIVKERETDDIRWPELSELWAICGELMLEGSIVGLPHHIVGQELPLEGWGSVTAVQQAGAVQGSPAAKRFELGGGLVRPQGVQA